MANYPSLSVIPFPIKEEYEDSVLRSKFEGGYELTRARYTRSRKKFTLTYAALSESDKNTLDGFVLTTKCGADSFTWTHPKTSVAYTVRFARPPQFETITHTHWKTEVELVQA